MQKVEQKDKSQPDVLIRGAETYSRLREAGLNIIVPRPANESLDPDAPRTLMDILGESSHRIRVLRDSSGEDIELELESISLFWAGLETEAKVRGDDTIAAFIKEKFIIPFFIEK